MKFGKAIPTPIRIMPTDSQGFIIDIGFATFSCETSEGAIDLLQSYLTNPSLLIEELEAIRGKGGKLQLEQIPPKFKPERSTFDSSTG